MKPMKYTVNLLDTATDPIDWARRREAEGWDGLSVAVHVFTGRRAYPHVWFTATAVAMATTHATISTAFANNLFRGPVEVAQAALQLQRVSGGRFELGLGAGWADDEVIGSGLRSPPPGTRNGALGLAVMASVTDNHLYDLIDRVRAARPTIEISMFTLFSVGDDDVTRSVKATMDAGSGLFRRFFGSPDEVTEGLAWLESLGISGASLSPMTDHALEALAPAILGGRR